MKTLLAVDGNSILNRAFYGIRPLTTKDGFPTNALFGMVTMITRQIETLKPDALAVAFDLKAPTFRHRMYSEYKAGRRPMPEALVLQLPVAKELMRALGFHVLEIEGYEADDILGTLAEFGSSQDGCEVYLMTGDRDALQLIGEHVHVLLATNQETVDTDEAKFFEKYGVHPDQFVDVKALMGDSSDHIPGVPGIGEKTALKLIAEYGSLDGVYAALPDAKLTPSVRTRLTEGKESGYLSQKLARICRDVPLDLTDKSLNSDGIRREEARDLFLRLEFSAFLKRFSLDQPSPVQNETQSKDAPLLRTSAELSEAIKDCNLIAVDSDAQNLYLSDGEHLYTFAEPLSELEQVLRNKTLICYDCKSLYKLPLTESLRRLSTFDLMLCAYLINSAKSSYEFSSLVTDYLGELFRENEPRVWYFHALYRTMKDMLEGSGQSDLLNTLEMPLAAVLADMETTGFRIDREGIASYGDRLGTVAKELEARIYFRVGKEFNIQSPKQLGEVLFETLGLPHAKKTKTGYSTNAEILEKLRPYHPVIEDILDYRQVSKLKSTYTDGLLKVADGEGRVHTTFKQTGTATGRLSSTEPNLQNIPIRTELGRELRRFFLPKNKNYVLIDADYSQIELRLLAHISADKNMIRAFRDGADIHTSTAATVFGVTQEEVTPEMRKKAKAVNFGILYGIGAFSLSDDLHISRVQAQEYIDQYLASYPGIDAYLKNTIRAAYKNGYVTTLFGRRRYIPELSGTNKNLQKFGERVAMNSPIQGTAADIIKLAMIRVQNRLCAEGLDARLILQVHDELLVEANRSCAKAAEEVLREEMEHVAEYSVPLSVDIHVGETWFDAK